MHEPRFCQCSRHAPEVVRRRMVRCPACGLAILPFSTRPRRAIPRLVYTNTALADQIREILRAVPVRRFEAARVPARFREIHETWWNTAAWPADYKRWLHKASVWEAHQRGEVEDIHRRAYERVYDLLMRKMSRRVRRAVAAVLREELPRLVAQEGYNPWRQLLEEVRAGRIER